MNNSVQSEINIIANITDNQATYKCEAKNSATDVASIAEKTLSVHCKFTTYKYSCCFLLLFYYLSFLNLIIQNQEPIWRFSFYFLLIKNCLLMGQLVPLPSVGG